MDLPVDLRTLYLVGAAASAICAVSLLAARRTHGPSAPALVWGACSQLLVSLSLLVSALLALMAVVFAGQGVAALQEAGRLPATPVSGPTVALLGIHPTLQGLGLQGALLLFIAVLFYLNTRDSNRPAAA